MLRRFLPLVLLPLSLAAGRDPAKLNVIVTDLPNGKSFAFEIKSLMDKISLAMRWGLIMLALSCAA